MTLPISVSGETQFWSSVNDWLTANVPAAGGGFTYFFDQALDPTIFPSVEVGAFNSFEPGTTAMDDLVFPKNPDQNHTQGRFNQVLMEINIRTDGGPNGSTDALQKCRLLKDAFVYALQQAGMVNEATQTIPIPPIIIKDSSNATTNTFARLMTEQDNCIIKNFFKPSAPESLIFRYQLIFKMQWVELT